MRLDIMHKWTPLIEILVYTPRSCVDRTDFSSSPCIKAIVRCRASVTLLLASMSASSLPSYMRRTSREELVV